MHNMIRKLIHDLIWKINIIASWGPSYCISKTIIASISYFTPFLAKTREMEGREGINERKYTSVCRTNRT